MSTEILSWHHAFSQHCLVMKGLSKYTIAGSRDAIKSFIKFTESTLLTHITLPTVESWIAAGTAQHGWSPVTSRLRIRYMSLFAKWLVSRKLLPENPLVGISLPRIPKRIPKSLSRNRAQDLLRFARNQRFRSRFEGIRAYAIVAMFLYTGIRMRELRTLELRDVDLENHIVSVRGGKGSKDRIIPIPPQLNEVASAYLSARALRKADENPYFFLGIKGKGKLGEKVLRRTIAKIREASGIYFAPHLLRHTYATLLLEGGCDLFSLSKLMGHENIKTTAIYLSATVQHLQAQVSKHPVSL